VRSATLLLIAALLGGATAGPAADKDDTLDRAIANRTPGAAVDCVDRAWVHGPTVIDQRTLAYRDGRTLWINRLPDACPSLDDKVIMVSEATGSRICRGDAFRTVEPYGSVASGVCRLGAFTPYRR